MTAVTGPKTTPEAADTNPRRLWIAETFADTVQGEGPSTGVPAAFIRLSRCNLDCVWCDTPYTWDRKRYDLEAESRRVGVDDLARWAVEQHENLIVLTGGEPLLQQRAVVGLVRPLVSAGKTVEIETNGTYVPAAELVASGAHFNVSPKLAHSGIPEALRIHPGALTTFAATPRAVFKFVARSTDDLAEIDTLVARFGLAPVLVMPEGTTALAVIEGMRALESQVVTRGYRLGTRLHVLLWGDERGR